MLQQLDTGNTMSNEWTDYEPVQPVVPPLAPATLPAPPDTNLSEPPQLFKHE
jgi:hypothetical protein